MESTRYFNRELSWIEFNRRVFEVAKEMDVPLFEKVKFLAIVSSNFDEFYMIRVGSLLDQISAGIIDVDFSGMTPKEQLDKILVNAYMLESDKYLFFKNDITKMLDEIGISLMEIKMMDKNQKKFIDDYYESNIFPVITPIVVQNTAAFPLVLNKSLNIGLEIEDSGGHSYFATVQVPSVLNRLIEVPSILKSHRQFVYLEDIIKDNLDSLFNGHVIHSYSCYRITRNADLTLDEEEEEDLLITIEESLKQRKWGAVVRLEVESHVKDSLLETFLDNFEIERKFVSLIDGPLDLTYLMKLANFQDYDDYKYPLIHSKTPQVLRGDIFEAISESDLILHHPYEAFEPIVKLIQEAAEDPKVLAIKQTLYRVSGKSPIVEALIKAAENGKQVTVLVELKARFDEENNIIWAKRLEKAGCHVIYGIANLKTHCKILLIVRMEDSGIKRYVHLGTGNYNDITAKLYTDLSLLTCNAQIGGDASMLFNMLSGNSKIEDMHKLYISPINLRDKLYNLIDREIENAKVGKKAIIIIKINSLVDENIIEKLYEASLAGVKIKMVVRGICCLKPGVKGLSENISVTSIVGRFLEHSRVYYFYDDGEETIYLSSADLMKRNLDRRVELLFPIEDKKAKNKVMSILNMALSDNSRAKSLKSDGRYKKSQVKGKNIDFQVEMLKSMSSKRKNPKDTIKEFIPLL